MTKNNYDVVPQHGGKVRKHEMCNTNTLDM